MKPSLLPAAILGVLVGNTCMPATPGRDIPEQAQPRQDLIDSRPNVARNAKEQRLAEQLRLTTELLKERQNRVNLRLTYSDEHPAVMQSNRKMEELEKRLRELAADGTAPSNVPAPAQ